MSYLKVSLEAIAGGKAIVEVNHQIQKVINNCLDVNTDPKATRSVTLKINFKPTIDRANAEIEFTADCKLATESQGVDQLFLNQREGFVQDVEQLKIFCEDKDENLHEIINPITGEVTGGK